MSFPFGPGGPDPPPHVHIAAPSPSGALLLPPFAVAPPSAPCAAALDDEEPVSASAFCCGCCFPVFGRPFPIGAGAGDGGTLRCATFGRRRGEATVLISILLFGKGTAGVFLLGMSRVPLSPAVCSDACAGASLVFSIPSLFFFSATPLSSPFWLMRRIACLPALTVPPAFLSATSCADPVTVMSSPHFQPLSASFAPPPPRFAPLPPPLPLLLLFLPFPFPLLRLAATAAAAATDAVAISAAFPAAASLATIKAPFDHLSPSACLLYRSSAARYTARTVRALSESTAGGAWPMAVASPMALAAASSAAADSGMRCGRTLAAFAALERSGEEPPKRSAPPAPKEDDRPFTAKADLRERPGVINRGRSGEGPPGAVLPKSARRPDPDDDLRRPSLRGGVDMEERLGRRRAGESARRGAGAASSSEGKALAAMAAASPAGPPGWLMEVRDCAG